MIEELRRQMRETGFDPPEIVLNNKYYRFKSHPRDDKNSAWLIGHTTSHGYICATWSSYHDPAKYTFKASVPRVHQKEYRAEQEKFAEQIEKERTELADRAAVVAKELYDSARAGKYLTPYLKRKNVKYLFGAHCGAGELIVPMTNAQGELRGAQTIKNDGEKRFVYGTAKKGLFHVLQGSIESASKIYIAEGFATTATIAQALWEGAFVCAFDAGNLEHVARAVYREDAEIVICSDNDPKGIEEAERAAKAINARVVLCPIEGKDFNDVGEDVTFAAFQDPVGIVPIEEKIILRSYTGKNSLDSLQMVALCNGKLLYDSSVEHWFRFDSIWKRIHPGQARKVFMMSMDAAIQDGYSKNQLDAFFTFCRWRLERSQEWNKDKNLLPFANGILNVEKMELYPHSPDFFFNWCVPYKYDPTAKCPRSDEFLTQLSQGNPDQEDILVAYLAAILRGRADLQRYLELIGQSGTGKTTYIKLAEKLVGSVNATTTSMNDLANKFETSGFYGKRLVYITDAQQYSQSVDTFKSLTGQDPLRYEEKNKNVGEPFVYDGMVLVAANNAIHFDDKSTAIARRRITVNITKPLDVVDSRINEKLEAELPGLVNRLLEVPNEWIDSVLTSATSIRSESRNAAFIETNPVAQWLDEMIVLDPMGSARMGHKKRLSSGTFEEFQNHLYPSYLQWCSESNRKEMSLHSFSHALVEIIQTYRWPVVRKRKTAGWIYSGLRVRRPGEDFKSIF